MLNLYSNFPFGLISNSPSPLSIFKMSGVRLSALIFTFPPTSTLEFMRTPLNVLSPFVRNLGKYGFTKRFFEIRNSFSPFPKRLSLV